jgi:host factor-I protein
MTAENQNFSTLEQAFSLGNGQDSALNWLRKNRSQVAIFLVSGIKLEGIISGFDQYSVLLTDAHGNQQMIYKAKISTIALLTSRMGSGIQRPRRPSRPGMERGGSYEDRRNHSPDENQS